MYMKKIKLLAIVGIIALLGAGCEQATIASKNNPPENNVVTPKGEAVPEVIQVPETTVKIPEELYKVTRVVDGDTVDVQIGEKVERIRIIGIDTPEIVDPRKPVQCFGKESSDTAKKILEGASVSLKPDTTQNDRDTYGRLLRYIALVDGTDFGLMMIKQGFAHEYTYIIPYERQAEYKTAETDARTNKRGLWADAACASFGATPVAANNNTNTNAPLAKTNCLIKGNISTEKIYHLPGCGSYDKTVIDESKGERWFCTEPEATAAGWRKAKNCP